MVNTIPFNLFSTPGEIQLSLAESAKQARLSQNHSRKTAAELSGVPMETLKRFENTGEISLRQFLMLCQTYGDFSAVEHFFPKKQAQTIDELFEDENKPKRQRGRS